MKTNRWIAPLFVVAAIYDGALGIAFLFFGPSLFAAWDVTPPNHYGYIQFPALILVLFGIMFARIAADPPRRRELIGYGCGLKAAYAGTVFVHALRTGIPGMWIPWAWADLAFLVLFALAWGALGRREDPALSAPR